MEQTHRSLVEPQHVVEHERERARRDERPEKHGDRIVEPGAVVAARRVGCFECARQQRRQDAVQPLADLVDRKVTQRVDPCAQRSPAFRFERSAAQDTPAARFDPRAQLLEDAALADARIADGQENRRPLAVRGRVEGLVEDRTLAIAADKRRYRHVWRGVRGIGRGRRGVGQPWRGGRRAD